MEASLVLKEREKKDKVETSLVLRKREEEEEEVEVEIVSEFLGRECKDRVVFASPLLPAFAPHPCFAGRTSRGGKLPGID